MDRYNHLFRGLLRAELASREPDLSLELRRRAGRWCKDNGRSDVAIDHAMAAGDDEHVAQLVLARALPMYHEGDLADLRRWFAWFDDPRDDAGPARGRDGGGMAVGADGPHGHGRPLGRCRRPRTRGGHAA